MADLVRLDDYRRAKLATQPVVESEEPDDDCALRDQYGRKMFIFHGEYETPDKRRFTFEFEAYNREDAEVRMWCIRQVPIETILQVYSKNV